VRGKGAAPAAPVDDHDRLLHHRAGGDVDHDGVEMERVVQPHQRVAAGEHVAEHVGLVAEGGERPDDDLFGEP
jgi:hypothetical protein